MLPFIVLYRNAEELSPVEPPCLFICDAGDAGHAVEQCLNAYPTAQTLWVVQTESGAAAYESYYGWFDAKPTEQLPTLVFIPEAVRHLMKLEEDDIQEIYGMTNSADMYSIDLLQLRRLVADTITELREGRYLDLQTLLIGWGWVIKNVDR